MSGFVIAVILAAQTWLNAGVVSAGPSGRINSDHLFHPTKNHYSNSNPWLATNTEESFSSIELP